MGGALLRILTKGGKGMSIKIDRFVLPSGLRIEKATYEDGLVTYAIYVSGTWESNIAIRHRISEEEYSALLQIARDD